MQESPKEANGFEEIMDIETEAKVCDALGHPVRALIYNILFIKEDLPIVKVVDLLVKEGVQRDYKTIRSHIDKMVESGIISMHSVAKSGLVISIEKEIEIRSYENHINMRYASYVFPFDSSQIFVPVPKEFFSQSVWPHEVVYIPNEVSRICDALSHPTRVKIYKFLLDNERPLIMVTQLPRDFGQYNTITMHLSTLAKSGLIGYFKPTGMEYTIHIKKVVKIFSAPFNRTG